MLKSSSDFAQLLRSIVEVIGRVSAPPDHSNPYFGSFSELFLLVFRKKSSQFVEILVFGCWEGVFASLAVSSGNIIDETIFRNKINTCGVA